MAQRKGEKQKQGEDESVHYELTLVPPCVTPGITTVWDKTTDTPDDVTSETVSGSSILQQGIMFTPAIHSLVRDHTYRVECQYTDGKDNLLEVWFEIIGEE